MKKLALTSGLISFAVCAQAQETSQKTQLFWADPLSHPLWLFYVIAAFVLVVAVVVILVALYTVRVINLLTAQAEQERARRMGIAYVPRPSWWQRFSEQVNASVPLEQEKSIEMDHNYDGIKELDNHLPPWWKWLFYATIIWSAAYLIIYHISNSLPLSEAEYETEVLNAEEQMRKLKAMQPVTAVDENSLVFSVDSVALIASGERVYQETNCGSCHRNDGGGNAIGPNLTDAYWLHGGAIKDVFNTIKNGVVEKGMPAWGKSLSPQQVRDVTYFVLSLQGSNPANAKSPQGVIYQEEVASDSIKTQASL